jgi:sensor histidine kinase regulating citrate/malate metabolism
MKVAKLFQLPMFGTFLLFMLIAVSTSMLCIQTVDDQLSAEYEVNSRSIAQSIANSSMDIILNRDLSTLQSLIDQFKEIQGIKYIYITEQQGDILAHTFVPGVPKEIVTADRQVTATIERNLAGIGDFIEVSSPILDGVIGAVHVGMDQGAVKLKIRTAIARQAGLIAVIFVVSIIAAYALMNLAARPLARLGQYADQVVAPDAPNTIKPEQVQALLERKDEVGRLARVIRHLAVRPAPEQS